VISAELSKPIDARKNRIGDKVEARITMDLLANGQVLLRRDSKILGHVTAVLARSQASLESAVAVVFDFIQIKGGGQVPLQASLQAVAAPLNHFAAEDVSPVGAADGAPRSTLKGRSSSVRYEDDDSKLLASVSDSVSNRTSAEPRGALDPGSRGIFGLAGLAVDAANQVNIFSSTTRNVHLDSGTQIVLRTR
jgi:hypothetical protein